MPLLQVKDLQPNMMLCVCATYFAAHKMHRIIPENETMHFKFPVSKTGISVSDGPSVTTDGTPSSGSTFE